MPVKRVSSRCAKIVCFVKGGSAFGILILSIWQISKRKEIVDSKTKIEMIYQIDIKQSLELDKIDR